MKKKTQRRGGMEKLSAKRLSEKDLGALHGGLLVLVCECCGMEGCDCDPTPWRPLMEQDSDLILWLYWGGAVS